VRVLFSFPGSLPGNACLAGSSPLGPGVVGGTGVSPVNDGQDARPTKAGQSPGERHSQAEPGNEKKGDFQIKAEGQV